MTEDKYPMQSTWLAVAIAIAVGAVGGAIALGVARRSAGEVARCGIGFVVRGARCIVEGEGCPLPLVATAQGCDAPEARVAFADAVVVVGPSDWEAEGRVTPRSIQVKAFQIDAFEVTSGRWDPAGAASHGDRNRAAFAMTRDEAESFCATRGGRLPTEDEWMVAAASAASPVRRYPWGDTGAVCRRAAWGLATGPCALSGDGPDTVGAHPDGQSPLGLHDLAGNVAEWVAAGTGGPTMPTLGVAKGGSWRSALATELRIWARLELSPNAHDPRVGLRCAYPP